MNFFLNFQVLKEILLILIEDTERDYKKVFLFPSKRIMDSMNSFFYKDIFLSMLQNFNFRFFSV